MKKLTIILFLLLAANANAQWEKIPNGLSYNSEVWSMAVIGNNLFAGTNYGVYITSNNGTNWTRTNLTQSGNTLLAEGNNIYAGTKNGVYITSNNGQNWSKLGTGMGSVWVWSLAKYGDTIFAGSDGGSGIYRSTNNGLNWTQHMSGKYISSVVIKGNTIFAGDWQMPVVWRSTNNGLIWDATDLGGQYPRVVLSLAVKDSILFAGTDNDGIFISRNNGENWEQTNFDDGSVVSFYVLGDKMFMGLAYSWYNGVYLSTNNGKDWIHKNQGMGSNKVWSIIANNQYIFAGADSSAYRRPFTEIISVQNTSTEIPTKYFLSQNYPNPFNPSTVISFQLPVAGDVSLKVYDIQGREVQSLINERLNAGTYETTFEAGSLTSGVYLYKIQCGYFSDVKRMVLIK